jgi:hypothetical protein
MKEKKKKKKKNCHTEEPQMFGAIAQNLIA